MRRTIAGKLTLRIGALLLTGLIALCVGSYHSVKRIVTDDTVRYAKAILSMYCDMIAYDAEKDGVPVDRSMRDEIDVYSRYICEWYQVDCIYLYKPDPEKHEFRYLELKYKDPAMNDAVDWLYDIDVDYGENPLMMDVLNGVTMFGIVEDDRDYFNTIDIIMKLEDTFGNRLIAGVTISLKEIMQEVLRIFTFIAAVLIGVFVLLTVTIYRTLVRRLTRPAKTISSAMTEFISDGKRTDVHLEEDRNDEFGMIAQAFNTMTRNIDDYLKDIRSLNQDREDQQSQLETASHIQKGFLPPERYMTKELEIRAMMAPAKDVGGDLYDYLPLGDDRLLFVVADVSGKGMPASLFMSVTLMLIRQHAREGLSPAQILENVNDTLSQQNPRMLFATAFVGIFCSRTRRLTYANAGHNPPYILHDSLRRLEGAQNTLMGLFAGEEYREETVTLNTGDVLFLYTDGADEATDPENHFYGTDRLEKTLLEAKAAHEEDLIRCVSGSLTAFAAGSEQHDDITLMTVTVKDTRELTLDVDQREFSKIRETILGCALPRQLLLDLCLAAEEIFVNICSYAFEGRSTEGEKIRFALEHSDRIVMRFTDHGIPYDPRESVISADEYDMDLQIGGLGKLIAFNVADKVDYEYTDGKNNLTVTKYIKEDEQNDHSAEQ